MLRDFPWSTVFILVGIGLIRPLINLGGPLDDVGPAAAILISVVIAVAWIAVTVSMRVKKPVLVLAAAGAFYAILSVLLSVVLQTTFPEALGETPVSTSLLLTAGLAGALITNVIWGAFLGMTSQVIMKVSTGGR